MLCVLVVFAGLARLSEPLLFWSPTALLPMPYTQMVVASPADDETLYAVASDASAASGLFESVDAGRSWVQIAATPAEVSIDSLAIDPSDPHALLMTTRHFGTAATVVYRSPDGGTTWSLALDPGVSCGPVGFAPGSAVAFVGCGPRLFRTIDRGETWSSVPNPTRPGPFSPAPDGSLFALGYGEAILRTTDDGSTWTVAGSVPSECSAVNWLAVSPESSLDLLVGAAMPASFGLLCGGLFRSGDGGTTWEETLPDRDVTQIVYDLHSPSRAYASTAGSGLASPYPLAAVFVTEDGGRSWSDLRLPEVSDLPVGIALSASGRALYAFSYAGTVFAHRFRRPTLLEPR